MAMCIRLQAGQVFRGRSELKQDGVSATVPIWGFLCVREIEGAGDQEHYMDLGVYRARGEKPDTRLYTIVLIFCK